MRFNKLCIFLMMIPALSYAQVDQDLIQMIDIEKNIQLKKEKKPTMSQLEIGIGYGFGSVPDYPASDESTNRSLLLPLFIYRGDVLKSDQEGGTRAELFKSRELELHLSFGARFNNDSSDNKARLGMPDLNYIFETGPSIHYKLWQSNQASSLRFQLPLRFTFETDFKATDFLGFVLEPELRLQKENFLFQGLKSNTALSIEYFTDRVADYYYGVDSQFVNSQRTAYEAQSGLSAIKLGQSFLYRYNQYNLIFGVTHSDFRISEHQKSPLFKTQQNTSLFVAVAWFFYQRTSEISE